MQFKGRKRMQHHLNLTPLIDIVFLLLIFFMLTTNFVDQGAIKLELPKANNGAEKRKNITVSIDGDKKIYMGTQEVALVDLPALLEEKLNNSMRKNVVIRGDKGVDFGLAVRVMDIARGAGAEGMLVATELESSK